MAWQAAAPLAAIGDGAVLGVDLGGIEVALYRMGDTVFATHGICTHALAFLKDGFFADGEIECPLHQGRFDVRSGRAMCAPLTRDIARYAVELREGVVWVDPQQVLAPAAQPAQRATGGSGRVVIVGAGQAAAACIRTLRAEGFSGSIELIGAEAHLPYERPALSKTSLTDPGAGHPPCLTALDAAALDVRLHLGRSAVAVDDAVALDDGTRLPFDHLVLATGGAARRLSVPGAELPGVFHLRTREDALAIATALRQARHAVLVGGGFIGLELASAARALGVAVTLLETSPGLMTRLLPPALGEVFSALATSHGVALRLGAAVSGITVDGAALAVVTPAGAIVADCVLVGVGLVPEIALAEVLGLDITQGAIAVDADGRASREGIFAIGDCAARRGQPRLESWQNAEESGAAAARAIAASPARPEKRPWFWTDQFGRNIQLLGTPGPGDRVAMRDDVFVTCDPKSLVPRAVMALDGPGAIRAARALLDEAQPFDAEGHEFRWLDDTSEESIMDNRADIFSRRSRFTWPAEGLTRIPDWVYTDQEIYAREVEKIFHGRTWNCVGLESEIDKPGDFIRSHVGPTPVVVSRAEDGTIHVFENRCTHRAAEFCRELSGNVGEFVCPYHQWTYDLKGNLQGVPFRRGVGGQGGMPDDFRTADHGPRKLAVTTHRGVIFASYADDMESLADYLGPEVLREFEATFDGRKLKILGHYRHTLPGNWKLYHENLKDPYHATLLHTFLVTFGLLVAGNKSLMLADASGRHGVMCSAKSDKKVNADDAKEMRAYKEGMTLSDPRIMDFFDEFDSPWSVTMATIWPNLIIQREMNTLGIRQIVPTGPNEFIMKWTMFGFEGDTPEMERHRLRQGNLMGPAGFLGLEDNEAMKFVQDGMLNVPGGRHLVALDPATPTGTSETLISESAIRGMYRHWREVMEL
jgi:anthranilate 1,2-dioxygenase large subunit